MLKTYYVYIHRRKDTGEVFYIGKGTGNRLSVRHKRSPSWLEVEQQAGGFIPEIIFSTNNESDAIAKENYYLLNPESDWVLVNKSGPRKVLNLSLSYFNKHLVYDCTSPSGLRWKTRSSPRIRGDLQAGYLEPGGYWSVRVQGKLFSCHRIVWLLNNGEIPENMVINHIDNTKSNNNIGNLELVTQSINSQRSIINKNPLNSGILYSELSSGYKYWIAYWHSIDSKRSSKSFNCDKYGFDEAKLLATEYRKLKLLELNSTGAGYNV